MKRLSKWTLGVAGVLAAAWGIFYWIAYRRATPVLERHEREVAAKVADLRSRHDRRPPPFGDELPGNAWEYYEGVLDAFGKLSDDDRRLIPQLTDKMYFRPDDARLEVLIEKQAAQVEQIREALRRTDISCHPPYEEGIDMRLAHVSKAHGTALFLAAGAEFHHRRGADKKSWEWVVMALGVLQDTLAKVQFG